MMEVVTPRLLVREEQELDVIADAIRGGRRIVERHRAPRLRPPFNESARRQAGFSQQELDELRGA